MHNVRPGSAAELADYTILYCTILYYTILYYTSLYTTYYMLYTTYNKQYTIYNILYSTLHHTIRRPGSAAELADALPEARRACDPPRRRHGTS